MDISPQELKQLLDEKVDLVLLDVREITEIKIASIGGTHIPLTQLGVRFQELNKGADIIAICHHGVRSRQAAHFLSSQGFTKVRSLSGGIDRWSTEIDANIPRY